MLLLGNMVQALTPEQSKAIIAFLWESMDKMIWIGLGYLGVRIHKMVKNIRPDIVADVVAAVIAETAVKLNEHASDDQKRFDEVDRLIKTEAHLTRKEIHSAIQEHVSHLHGYVMPLQGPVSRS